nr:hypothetical protein [Mycobacterium ulcerans]
MPEIVGLSDGVEAGLDDGGRVDCHASVARQSIEDLSCVGFVGATLGVGGLSAASAIGMVASATMIGADCLISTVVNWTSGSSQIG